MMRITLSVVLWMSTLAAGSADQVSQRALSYCVDRSSSVVLIEDCLPAAEIASVVTSTVFDTYAAAGIKLMTRCRNINDFDLVASSRCAYSAIGSSARLAMMIPSGSVVPEPLFDELKNLEKAQTLTLILARVQKRFKGNTSWRTSKFRPLE